MTAKPHRRREPELVISGGIFSQKVLFELVDDWIVPTLVEEFLRIKMNLPDPADAAHNETQP